MTDAVVSRETSELVFGPELWCGDHVAPFIAGDGSMIPGYGTATVKLVHEAGGQAGIDVADRAATEALIAQRAPLCCYVGLSVVAQIRAQAAGTVEDAPTAEI